MAKKQKKSKLKKRIDDHNSKLWLNKADTAWRKLVFHLGDGKCMICGSQEFVQTHHLIPREMRSHRHIVINGINLCASHHKYSFEISPHKAPVAFFRWMISNQPERWNWLLTQNPDRKNSITLKETYEILATRLKTEISAFDE